MNFLATRSLVHHRVRQLAGTDADIILGLFPELLKQAMRDIQQRRSWRCMKDVASVTILASTSSIALPATFKEPRGGTNALRGTDPFVANSIIGWTLLDKSEAAKMFDLGIGIGDRFAYIEEVTTAGLTTSYLRIFGTATAGDIAFSLDCYSFLPALSADTDTNQLMEDYWPAVFEKASAYAFQVSNREDAVPACLASYELALKTAMADDAYREVAGRNFRMGGY